MQLEVISLKRSNIADNISEDKSQYTNERFAKESPAGKYLTPLDTSQPLLPHIVSGLYELQTRIES